MTRILLNLWISITHTQTHAVRRVVGFFDSVRDLVEENDRPLLFELEPLEDGYAYENGDGQHAVECVYQLFSPAVTMTIHAPPMP